MTRVFPGEVHLCPFEPRPLEFLVFSCPVFEIPGDEPKRVLRETQTSDHWPGHKQAREEAWDNIKSGKLTPSWARD